MNGEWSDENALELGDEIIEMLYNEQKDAIEREDWEAVEKIERIIQLKLKADREKYDVVKTHDVEFAKIDLEREKINNERVVKEIALDVERQRAGTDLVGSVIRAVVEFGGVAFKAKTVAHTTLDSINAYVKATDEVGQPSNGVMNLLPKPNDLLR